MKAFPSKRPVIKNLGKFGPIEFAPVVEDGMDLRDYFAAKAMQAIMSSNWTFDGAAEASKLAYRYADAMIERRKTNE